MEFFKNVIYRVFAFVFGSLILCGFFSFYSSAADVETYEYELNYYYYLKSGNWYKSAVDYGTFELPYRICMIHHSANDEIINENESIVNLYYELVYFNVNTNDLHALSNKNLYLDFSFTGYKVDGSIYTQFNSNDQLYQLYASCINSNIPIFEDSEDGLSEAKNYLETGTLPVKEGYDIYLDNLQVSDVIDDVVNITWDGYILDPALHSKSIVGYKVKRNVFPFIILSDGESDTGWQPWQSLPHYIDGKLIESEEPNSYKFEQFIFDSFPFFENITLLRGKREEDFAPVKNKEGNDSPKTAAELYNNYWKNS